MKTILIIVGIAIITISIFHHRRRFGYSIDLYSHLQMAIGNQLPGITKTIDEISKWGGTSWPHDFEGN